MVNANEQFVIDALSTIDWFSNCGSMPENTEDIVIAKTHESIIKTINSTRWLNIKLDAQGDITTFLCNNYRNEYNLCWNPIIKEANALIEKSLLREIVDGLTLIGLNNDDVLNVVLSHVRLIIAANAWEKYIESPFFRRLLIVYQSGHLPCGWKGTPKEGKLIVY